MTNPYDDLRIEIALRQEFSARATKAEAENERLLVAIGNYLAVFDRCGGLEAISPDEFAEARQGLRDAFEQSRNTA